MSTHIDKDEPNDANKNFKVVIRVRPPLPRELDGDKRFQNIVRLDSSRQIRVSENLAALDDPYSDEAISTNFSTYTFTFDHVYGEDNDQKSVYENTAREAVMSTLQGYNATIIAYGQTGTGKTYTMEGEPTKQKRGLIPRATEEIFRHIEGSASEKKKFLVRASYLQIYNEVISDLLKPDRTNLHIREDKRKGVYVEGLSEWVVRSPKEVYGLMQRGASTRATAPTKMNEISSRSHAVFIIILEQLEYVEEADKGAASPEADGGGDMAQVFKVGKLNLVDLAGSERVRLTGATGQRLEESRKINQSLSALGNVIAALTTSGRQHIPYRDSKLTRILEDSLGGNCKTTMMAMISPALEAYVESLSTLKFANRAKNIKNEAHVNEDLDQKALLRKYEKEIKKLRSELEQKTKTVGDKRRLLQLQHQKEQAEKDKESVLIQLQLQSEEFMRAKEDKERLEQRLSLMESQLLEGGSQQHADAEAFQRALQKEQKRLQHEYDERVAKLEAQGGGGVKNILEQQRQVLTKLTERLRKRDECIARLQDELDAYDNRQKMTEDELDTINHQLINILFRLGKVAKDNKDVLPIVAEIDALVKRAGGAADRGGGGGMDGAGEGRVAFRRQASGPGDDLGDWGGGAGAGGAHLLEGGKQGGGWASADSDEVERLRRELEEVRSEKVDLEYVMRERLELIVTEEVSQRVKEISSANAAEVNETIRSLRNKIRELESGTQDSGELQQLQGKAKEMKDFIDVIRSKDTSGLVQHLEAMRSYCGHRDKERVAVRKIFEDKIKGVVDNVVKGLVGTQVQAKVTRDLQLLQNLVAATVKAFSTDEAPHVDPRLLSQAR